MAGTVIFDYISLHCYLDLEDNKPIFSHHTLVNDYSYHTKFGKKKKKKFSVHNISLTQTFTDTLNFHCDFEVECSNLYFNKTLQVMVMYHQVKTGCKKISSSEDAEETVIF